MPEHDRSLMQHIDSLLQGEEASLAGHLDRALGEKDCESSFTLLALAQIEAGRVAARLSELDRELRRCVALLAPITAADIDSIWVRRRSEEEVDTAIARRLRRQDRLPLPVAIERGGLYIRGASSGSLNFLIEGASAVAALLASQPVTTFLALLGLFDKWGRIRVWLSKRSDPLAKMSAKDALAVLKAFERGSAQIIDWETPDHDIEIGTTRTTDHRRRAGVVTLPDGTHVIGRRILHVRKNADGSQDILHVEG